MTVLSSNAPARSRGFMERVLANFLAWLEYGKIVGRKEEFLVIAAGALTISLFALTPTTTRIAVVQIDGSLIGIIRTVGAGVVAFPLLLILRLHPPAKWQEWKLLLISASGSFVGFPLLFSLGAQRTSASHAGLIMALMPLLTSLISVTIDRALPKPAWFWGATIAFAGAALLIATSTGGSSTEATLVGDLLVLGSCTTFSAGAVAGARFSVGANPWSTTFWSISIASVCLAPFAVMEGREVAWSEVTFNTWAALFHVTIGAGILAYIAWFWALSRGGITRVAPLQFAQPLLALVFAELILHERFSLSLLVTGTVIIAGIVITFRAGRSSGNFAMAMPKTLTLFLRDFAPLGGVWWSPSRSAPQFVINNNAKSEFSESQIGEARLDA